MVPLYDQTRHPCYNCRFPYAVVALITANVVVFLLELTNGPDWALQYALIPAYVVNGVALWTIVTSMFIHAGWLHLIGNMIYLWVFGDELDRYYMGPWRFLIFYFLCGFAATGLQVAIDPSLQIPNLGASGAVAGVLAGFLLVFPRDQIFTIFLVPIPIPVRLSALVLIGFWFLFQLGSSLLSLWANDTGGGVAYFAHVGGFIAGLLLVRLFASPELRPSGGSQA
jgi:membrane associated rhomboid family serine protease